MSNDNVQQTFTDNLKAAVEIGGPKEMNALSQQLNNMSYAELSGLNNTIYSFNMKEQAANPNLPTVILDEHFTNSPTTTTHDYSLDMVNKDGSEKTLYDRTSIDLHPSTSANKDDAADMHVVLGSQGNPDPGDPFKHP